MAKHLRRLALGELMATIGVCATALAAWRAYGNWWHSDEQYLALLGLAAWTAGAIAGRAVIGRVVLPCGVLCAVAGGGVMAWYEHAWQATAVVALASSMLGMLAAPVPSGIHWLVQRLVNRSTRTAAVAATSVGIAIVVATYVSATRFNYWIADRKVREFRQLSEPHGGGGSRVCCSRNARLAAVAHYSRYPSEVAVLDTQSGVVQRISLSEDTEQFFCDLSPNGCLIALRNRDDQAIVVVRKDGTQMGPIPDGRFVSFLDDTTLLCGYPGAGRVTTLWDISARPPRKVVRPFDLPDREPPWLRNEWLAALGAERDGASDWSYERRIPGSSAIIWGKIVGVGCDNRTLAFCEWEEINVLPSDASTWLKDIPFLRRRYGRFLRANLAAIDQESPHTAYRTTSVILDHVTGRWDTLILDAVLSLDGETVVVSDGHFNLAFWRIRDLLPP